MLYQSSSEDIADTVLTLSSKQIAKLLKENDEMLLEWNKSQLLRGWPRCLVPKNEKCFSNNLNFTSMIHNVKEKAYNYEQTLKPIQFNFGKSIIKQQSHIPEQFQQKEPNQEKQFKVEVQVGDNQAVGQNIQAEPTQNKSQHAKSLIAFSNLSPFLPNSENPFDRNANTKMLRQKFSRVSIDSKKRNIAALVEQEKNIYRGQDKFKYGKSVPKKTDSINIEDILKYTLGVKRDKQQGTKPEIIKNPFVRVPAKYYEPLGDFYSASTTK